MFVGAASLVVDVCQYLCDLLSKSLIIVAAAESAPPTLRSTALYLLQRFSHIGTETLTIPYL